MLTLLPHPTDVHPCQFSLLEALLEEPFPRTPEDLLQLEQRLSTAAGQVADQIVLVQLTRAHEGEAFVRQAMATCGLRAGTPRPQGLPYDSVLLLGGTRLVLETPYLREDRRGRRGAAAINGDLTVRAATRCWRPWVSPTVSVRPRARRSRCTWYRRQAIARRRRCSPGGAGL